MKNFLKSSYMGIILFLLYSPIAILILYSFNSTDSMSRFGGFSTQWYSKLAGEQPFLQSIITSLFVAVVATVVSTIIGTLAAIGLTKMRKVTQKMTLTVTNVPLINADVITAVALMMLFIAVGAQFGFLTLVLAHISFDIPYVIITILPRLRKIDNNLIEASLDLGATPSQTLRKVILPVLKPAIIAAAAIAFAMSFDDFIISYFTGGDDVNVATYIYTMKRVTPVINAFGAICIALIGLIVVGWNAYNIIKLNNNKFRREMLAGTYKDKQVTNYEKKLSDLYMKLNKSNLSLKEHETIEKRILRLEKKYNDQLAWIAKRKQNFIVKEDKRETRSETLRNKYRLIERGWKPILFSILIIGSFGLLMGLYINYNVYDLSIANWGEYINAEVLRDFEKKYNVRVRYVTYDSNETLYNKLYTTKYDVMVPSDYMVSKLAGEDRLEPLDYTKLNEVNPDGPLILPPNLNYNGEGINDNIPYSDKALDDNWVRNHAPKEFLDKCYMKQEDQMPKSCFEYGKYLSMDKGLTEILNTSKVPNETKDSIAKYSIPLYWGDMVLVINPTEDNINFINSYLAEKNKDLEKMHVADRYKLSEHQEEDLKEWEFDKVEVDKNKKIYSNGLSWDILWAAAKQNKRVLLNDDYKNLFMIAQEKAKQQVLPETKEDADQANTALKDLLGQSHVALMNDEITNAVKDGRFDFAFMYNGDAIDASESYREIVDDSKKLIIDRPRYSRLVNNKFIQPEGTNIWSDNMVISKTSKNKDLAYKFINYVISRQVDLTNDTGYTSPFEQVIEYVVKNEYEEYYREYIPVAAYDDTKDKYVSEPLPSDGPFYYDPNMDKYLIDLYNQLIASRN